MGSPKRDLAHLDGHSFLSYACSELSQITDAVYISTAQHIENLSYPQITDEEHGVADQGPLGGLLAAHRVHPTASWLLVACDLPAISANDLQRLIDASAQQEAQAYAFTNPIDGVAEATATLYTPSALAALELFLQDGHSCARKFLESLTLHTLSAPSPYTLQNVNHPADYQEWQLRATGGYASPALTLDLEFYAKLRQEAQTAKAQTSTHSITIAGLWEEVRLQYGLSLKQKSVKAAVNNNFVPWDYQLNDGDLVAFMPPFAGG